MILLVFLLLGYYGSAFYVPGTNPSPVTDFPKVPLSPPLSTQCPPKPRAYKFDNVQFAHFLPSLAVLLVLCAV